MADARDFLVLTSSGPLIGGAAGMSAIARDVAGNVRTAPVVTEVGEGVYRFTPTDDDETVGTVVCVDTGAGNEPRRVTVACFKPDRSNQFWGVAVENTDGTVWAGVAPTVGSYRSSAGARTPPALVAVEGAWLFVAVPTAGDVLADSEIRIDGPGGSAQPYWSGGTSPVVSSAPPAPPTPGELLNPATDVVAFLNGKVANGVTMTSAVNLFAGPMRSKDRTPAPCTFVLNTGGPAPTAYLQGHRDALFRPTVQVLIRGPAADLEVGEKFARAVFAWLHQRVTAPYLSWYARDSAPALITVEDATQHAVWSINVECHYRNRLDV